MKTMEINPKLDLTFERLIDVPPHLVWRAWTEPDLIKQWFCPLPWKTIHADVDVRPGGIMHTVMQSPEGQEFPGTGCYLETVKNERIVWTSALLPGYRPALAHVPCHDEEQTEFMFTAIIEMAPQKVNGVDGTRYQATVLHADEIGCQKHKAMGFEAGWSAALDQLVAMVKKGI